MGILPFRIGDRLLLRALAASLGLHLIVAFFLPIWLPVQSAGFQPIEALSFAKVIHIRIQRPAAAARPQTLPQTTLKARTVTFSRKKTELTAKTHSPFARPNPSTGPLGTSVAAAPRHLAAQTSAPLLARAQPANVPVSSTEHQAVQTPEPQSSQSARSSDTLGSSDRGGVLPFGAEQSPVLDPGVRARLAKALTVHVTLLVTVGEDGRTKQIQFQPPIDAQLEHEVETILADANWDAAVCGGGVSCQGVATIKL